MKGVIAGLNDEICGFIVLIQRNPLVDTFSVIDLIPDSGPAHREDDQGGV